MRRREHVEPAHKCVAARGTAVCPPISGRLNPTGASADIGSLRDARRSLSRTSHHLYAFIADSSMSTGFSSLVRLGLATAAVAAALSASRPSPPSAPFLARLAAGFAAAALAGFAAGFALVAGDAFLALREGGGHHDGVRLEGACRNQRKPRQVQEVPACPTLPATREDSRCLLRRRRRLLGRRLLGRRLLGRRLRRVQEQWSQ